MNHFLPQTANLGILETPAGLAVLSHEYKLGENRDFFTHSRFCDPIRQLTYEVRNVGKEAYVAVFDQAGERHITHPYSNLDHARAAAVHAIICGAQDTLEKLVNLIPGEILGIQALETA